MVTSLPMYLQHKLFALCFLQIYGAYVLSSDWKVQKMHFLPSALIYLVTGKNGPTISRLTLSTDFYLPLP